MKKAPQGYSVKELCRLFELPQSSYYYQPKGVDDEQEKILIKIKSIAHETNMRNLDLFLLGCKPPPTRFSLTLLLLADKRFDKLQPFRQTPS